MSHALPADLRDATPAELRAEVIRLRAVIAERLLPEIERLRSVEAEAREAVGLLLGAHATHTPHTDEDEV